MISPRGEGEAGADLVAGDYLIRFVARDVDDVRAIVGTDPEDERRFAAAARVSEINLGLYRSFLQPLVRATVSEPLAEWMRRMHPLRLQYELLSDQNPMMRPVAGLAERVREERKPAAADNPLAKLEAEVSRQIGPRSTATATCATAGTSRPSSPSTARRCCRPWSACGPGTSRPAATG